MNRFMPIPSSATLKVVIQQINRVIQAIDAETYTKSVSAGGKRQMISGKLPGGKYGEVFSDAQSVKRIWIGQAPTDARPGIWITKDGFDVEKEID